MEADQKPRRKLSVSNNSTLKQTPSASGSQGSTAGRSSVGFVSKNRPSSSSNVRSKRPQAEEEEEKEKEEEEAGKPQPQPLTRQRHGRVYLNAPGVSYPLPVDLPEIHRQALRTMLLVEVHRAPLRSPVTSPPKRVLEIGCGPGIWSLLCHRYFRELGYRSVSFTGIDIAPTESGVMVPDADMDWVFVQHDLINTLPWPFPDDHFDLVFHKEMTLAIPVPQYPPFSEEIFRVLKPGGILEVWEVDHIIRLLRPHTPQASSEESKAVMKLGAYVLNIATPLSAPLNPFLVEYNHWLSQALEKYMIMSNPCSTVSHLLISESELLTDIHSHRLAIPFSELRWEGQGVAKVITKNGKAYVDTIKGEQQQMTTAQKQKARFELTEVGAAARRTALLTLVQEIQAQELMLREVNGKSQDEWHSWVDKMTIDLMEERGVSWGECLETGAWWARKKETK